MTPPQIAADFTGPVVLVIEPAPGDWPAPAANRLRRLLKAMLRGYGWKCTFAGDRLPTDTPPSEPTGTRAGNESANTARGRAAGNTSSPPG